MATNDSPAALSTVLNLLRGNHPWNIDGTQLSVYVGLYTLGTFAAQAADLGWVLQADGSYERVNGDGSINRLSQTQLAQITVNSAQQAAITAALADWQRFANISIVTDSALADVQIWFGNRDFDFDTAGSVSSPTDLAVEVDSTTAPKAEIFFNTSQTQIVPGFNGTYSAYHSDPSQAASEYWKRNSYSTILHEIGHALNLNHPEPGLTGDATNSVMSVNDANPIVADGVAVDPMLYDVAAAQSLYGVNAATNAGDSNYYFLFDRIDFGVIWDASGTDTIDASGLNTNSYIDLSPGRYSAIGAYTADGEMAADLRPRNIAIAYRLSTFSDEQGWIENAVGGSGNDWILGNQRANTLFGGGGADFLRGGDGNDNLAGGDGDDVLFGDDDSQVPNSTDILEGGLGLDTYYAGIGDVIFDEDLTGEISFESFGALNGGEDLKLAGVFASDDFSLFYEQAEDGSITVYNELGELFIGIPTGVEAPEPVIVDHPDGSRDVIAGLANLGIELVRHEDADDPEHADPAFQSSQTGTAAGDFYDSDIGDEVYFGGGGNDSIFGDWGSDLLVGGEGNDFLYGEWGDDVLIGGAGDDVLTGDRNDQQGMPGNDVYVYTAGADAFVEHENSGFDIVKLPGGITPDNLRVTHEAQVRFFVVDETGEFDFNKFFALSGDILDFYADGADINPNVFEEILFADGTTWTIEDVRYKLLNGGQWDDQLTGFVTDDTMRGGAGADYLGGYGGNDELFGDAGADHLVGDAGDDRLDGGDDDDLQQGGEGNDTYIYAAGHDAFIEYDSEGYDVVDFLENTPDDFLVRFTGSQIHFYLVDETGTITLENRLSFWGDVATWIPGEGYELNLTSFEEFRFADEAVWTIADVREMLLTGGVYDDVLTGYVTGDEMQGGEGADTIHSYGGDDEIYGDAGNDAIWGGIGNDYIDGGADDDAIWGELGNDWIDGGSGKDSVSGEEGDDTLFAGTDSAQDMLFGGPGNDVLHGGLGGDWLQGQEGDDTYYVTDSSTLVMEVAGLGFDVIYASAPLPFGLPSNVEALILVGTTLDATGNSQANDLTGNVEANNLFGLEGNDVLYGLSGNDVLDGGAGSDTMAGGIGDDIFLVDDAGDVVLEGADEGVDTVQSTVAVTLSDNVENLILTGASGISGTGNALNNFLTGNVSGNTLNGGAGNDVLDGGLGSDTLIGGSGDDTYWIDNTGDVVNELSGEGIDTVNTLVTYTLGTNVENLTLVGGGAADGTGNGLDNILTGNGAANVLSGGAGNDTYYVGAGDTISEGTGAGTDTAIASVTWTLANNLENLTLVGTSPINGTGNTLANVLRGNSAANTLAGGGGNDTFYVSTGDSVSEGSNAGTDTVMSDVTWTLGNNVENLTLLGTAAINGTGNSLANAITGNVAANTLNGGTGADTLAGGGGDDLYVVDNAGDVVVESANEGVDMVNSSVTYTLQANVENLTLTGSSNRNGIGNALDNILNGNSGTNTLTGADGSDILDGKGGSDTMIGGLGDDVYFVDNVNDATNESVGEGIDIVNSSVTRTLAANLEHLILSGTSNINGTGNANPNLIRGNAGNNTLNGSGGFDVLEGNAGADTLSDTSGGNFFYGAAGNDVLTGGASGDLFTGGAGTDTITTGNGTDVIVFNVGDGQDTVNASVGLDDSVSLGGTGLAYADLSFQKNSNDLILNANAADKLTFKNWYSAGTNKNILNLQVVAEAMAAFDAGSSDPLLNQKVQNFDFQGLVGAFDAFLAANPGLTTWALSNGLSQFHLSGSDTEALGGDLAYYYGTNGTLAGMGFEKAQDVVTGSQFGAQAQTLHTLSGLQEGVMRLS
jgi:Ca2+-binding RTX toxin-like protein